MFVQPEQSRAKALVRCPPCARGVALVAVLSVLTLLALLAALFVVLVVSDMHMTDVTLRNLDASLLAESGVQHAIALLRNDAEGAGTLCVSPETAGFLSSRTDTWHVVTDTSGRIVGRYLLLVSDESGRLNVNTIPLVQSTAGDGRKQPAGQLPAVMHALERIQYGSDGAPGVRGMDDNHNNLLLEHDGVDNDWDGIVDEANEGVDEPDEYRPYALCGDDDGIGTLGEVRQLFPRTGVAGALDPGLASLLTPYSRDWRVQAPGAPQCADINGGTLTPLARCLRTAGASGVLGQDADVLRMAATIMDFRDENHVVSSRASSYGVESVCFSEVMANDGSHLCEPYGRNYITQNGGTTLEQKEAFIVGVHLDPYDKNGSPFRPTSVSRSGGGVKVTYVIPPQVAPSMLQWLKQRGKADAQCTIQFPKDFWRNAHMVLKTWPGQSVSADFNVFPRVVASDMDSVTVEETYGSGGESSYTALTNIMSNNDQTGFWLDNHWETSWGTFTCYPECSDWDMVQIRPDTYFRCYIGCNPFCPSYAYQQFKGNSPTLDCDGDPSTHTETQEKLLKWLYKDGEPQRSDKLGFVDIIVTSSRECNKQGVHNQGWFNGINNTKSVFTQAIFVRPDIVELFNLSTRPISLASWRVMINTGSMAKELLKIGTASHHDAANAGALGDPNPGIKPLEYAYLTSDEKIFDMDYGNTSKRWGDCPDEAYPHVQLPEETWGVWYKIIGFKPGRRNLWTGGAPSPDNMCILEGADFVEGEMTGEMIEYRSDRTKYRGNNLNGWRRMVTGNDRNSFETLYGGSYNSDCGIEKGDYAVIIGLPRKGGFASFTLRNEYNQVCTRTVEYGEVKHQDFNVSTELPNQTYSTVGNWERVEHPTFGGTIERARSLNPQAVRRTCVLNRPLQHIGELLRMSTGFKGKDFLTNDGQAKTFLKAVGPVVSLEGVRLDAENAAVQPAGTSAWRSTIGTVKIAAAGTLHAQDVQWEPEMWVGQTLSMLGGPCRGDQFRVVSNSVSSLTVEGRSTELRRQLSAGRGDAFMVGPAYRTPLFYSRLENAAGEWEWTDTGLEPGVPYDLFVHGLNDSIKTTEFLEENHNAPLTLRVWNYTRGAWEDPAGPDSLYDKNDTIFYGRIQPDNIGFRGAVRISVAGHNQANADCSGKAWLDYIYLAPRQPRGRINVNTAPADVLAMVPGIGAKLARTIAAGNAANGTRIKTYRSVFDLLEVQGMTPGVLCLVASYLTVRSDTFRVSVIAEAVQGRVRGKQADKEAMPQAVARVAMTSIVERKPEADNGWTVHVLEKLPGRR